MVQFCSLLKWTVLISFIVIVISIYFLLILSPAQYKWLYVCAYNRLRDCTFQTTSAFQWAKGHRFGRRKRPKSAILHMEKWTWNRQTSRWMLQTMTLSLRQCQTSLIRWYPRLISHHINFHSLRDGDLFQKLGRRKYITCIYYICTCTIT